ncbi:penicillin-binding protein 1A [Xanthomonas rydalmerensis]|uniref:Penicillin-binding protein 1A n=1 Tax=Xanthomonas rydalmerensis TaxID=3046274 RepID=A0ABZ0JR11_9XANT|nr:penicillin-binding protein 1A [Xanthomonas sp. DM-2023]WOS41821.1 penicillin-binding protein 1A [Xanthomonas sp. DM-2023]WOS46007.1 penicillin-binding protein 1A [Xanthomonas sp. DM-2023]WOS50186.1 penicillin-binding protein 1A [Xanthomonas sp. DM-2023]WOS54365.1 penicillin-binding protein 1A [Xanthomonas sp. DM-2023]WOS58548.1 penicillin-binding protein 1A [Xanthomonas sp. DM-2023]
MPRFRRWLRWALVMLVLLGLVGAAVAGGLYYVVSSKLPDVQTLRKVELQEPMYVYSSDGKLMALFGETRRYPITMKDVPERLKQAFLATEDARFYEHGGVDYKGIARAVWLLATTNDKRVPGGSTITQQVARQFFLSSEYSYTRKLAEILLARKIEAELTKDQIFELYLNKSFFGNRAYGIAAAAEYYYGKKLNELSLDEMASLAGIPKFPSSGNPISNPERAKQRRDNYVLSRMAALGFITPAEAEAAKAVPMHAAPHERPVEVEAPYVAELVRQEMIARFGGDVLDKGYHVYTSIDSTLQTAANHAVRQGLVVYDRRHGWHGVEKHFDLPANADAAALASHLSGVYAQGGMLPSIVASTGSDGSATVVLPNKTELVLPVAASRWTGRSPATLLKRGDLVRIQAGDKPGEWEITQIPRGQAALVSLDAHNGALRAMVGGFSYAGNKFNRATQARRQPGSSFKPFLYAASFEKGFNPASIVLDAPVVFRDRRGKTWSPQNDGGGFRGPMRLREALVQSRNLVSVRLLDAIGVDFARKYISQFGFQEAELPPNLSMSLGTASLTPLSVARGYTVFANGGSLVNTWIIDKVTDRDGNVLFQEHPLTACRSCGSVGGNTAPVSQVVDGFNFGAATPPPAAKPAATTAPAADEKAPATDPEAKVAPRAIDERTAYQLVSMMRDVVQRGTGAAAKVLGREDVGGKTGSTNDHRDAWFSGFGGPYVTTVWVGRDDYRSLGYREYGGKAALPIWIDYMRVALKDQPIARNDPPGGMVQVSLNGATEWVKTEDMDRIQQFDESLQDQKTDDAAFDIF